MNVGSVVARINQLQYQAAVWEELSQYLQGAEEGDLEIPVDLGDGSVPLDEIISVREFIDKQVEALSDKMMLLEDAEVSYVDSDEDLDLD